MPIATNPMKDALAAGKLQLGTWLNQQRNPAILTLLKSAGLDYARMDMEHSSPSMETVADFAILSRALNFPLVVRPPDGNREWITRLLDNGVWGLHVPQVDNAEIAYEIARAAHYAPMGMRGMAGLAPGNDFWPSGDVLADQAFVNKQVHVTIMLENPEAYKELDAMLAIDGIDAVTLGPTDLAQSLGVFGTPDEAKVIDEHRMMLIEAAKRHGKDVAMLVGTIEEGERWHKAGCNLIAYSSDAGVLRQGYMAAAKRLKG